MDINSLLSPQDTPKSEGTPTASSPHLSPNITTRPAVQARTSSGLSQQLTPDQIASTSSPTTQFFPRVQQISSPNAQPLLSPHAQAGQALRASQMSFTSAPASAAGSPLDSPKMQQQGTPQPARQASTPHMDTLADLASMQHQGSARQSNLHSPAITASQITAAQLARSYSPSSLRPSASRNATDQSSMSLRSTARQYTTKSLSQDDCDELNQTSATLHDSSLNYQAHISMIKLLHKGFLNHTTGAEGGEPADGRTYEFLADLRRAREAMDSIYPLGEDLWYEWIEDEQSMTHSVDDRIAVMNLCTKAVTDEPSSAKLWRQYGDYMYTLYASSNALPDGDAEWTEEDRIIGKEVFTWASMNNVWEQGVVATQWRLNDSSSVWDRYMEILVAEQKRSGQSASFGVEQLQQLFVDRLLQPHSTWDNTFQTFSMFMSANTAPEVYEDIMSQTNARASQAKQMWSLRDLFELKISSADKANDRDAEWQAYSDYLKWEVEKKGVFSGHLIVALYERAVTRFSAEATLWEDYVEYLIQDTPANVNILTVMERATRHCPWSGSLWSYRILSLEAAGKNFGEIEPVKHKATRTGILELAGIEELLKVYIAWCGFLRRRAFQDERSDEDDLDIAEVGIRSALEHVREVGEQLYGKDHYPGDHHYRLERIHIKFFTQAGNADAARAIWTGLAAQQRNSYDFWYRWYIWEMVMWAKFAMRPTDPKDYRLRSPSEATDVLKLALRNIETVDSPEQLVQMFLAHCEQHESVVELQNAFILTRKMEVLIRKRRQLEYEEAAAKQRAQYEQQSLMEIAEVTGAPLSADDVAMDDAEADVSTSNAKRKLEAENEDYASKKIKTHEAPHETLATAASAKTQPKRDREHTTVLVKKLPMDTTSTGIRKFFRDCGTIVNIKLTDEADQSSKTATIEFEAPEDAQFALSRNSRLFEGNEIEVTYACGSTLWVSNYPPEADQKYIRDLFQKSGDVVDVRFPSLKYNTHRRFCYVQFATPAQALAATSLDGTTITGTDGSSNDTYKLVAKISAPDQKADRSGALLEGREIHVANLHFFASEAELREVFGECGTVERVRIPKNVAGKSKGAAFVTLSSPEEAQAAVAKLDGHEIRGRAIKAEIARPDAGGAKRTATSVFPDRNRSQTPAGSANGDVQMNGTAQSPAASHASEGKAVAAVAAGAQNSGADRKERTLFLTNIPDTVNDARVRAFLEQFGQLRKLTLRPDHQGAIVEFASVADAGRAEMKIPDAAFEFDEGSGRVVKVVEEAAFFRTKEEWRSDKLQKGSTKKDTGNANGTASGGSGAAAGKHLLAPRISRPSQGGRRGGLGVKRSGVGLSGPRAASDGHGKDVEDGEMKDIEGHDDTGSQKKPKSNDDFRAMMMHGKAA